MEIAMKAWAKPVGYIRESQDDADQTPEAQKAGQTAAVIALAKRDGYTLESGAIFDDWDRSADERKRSQRHGSRDMLVAVRAGEVSAIYARSVDRLYRSVKDYVELRSICAEYGVKIVTTREGVVGGAGLPMDLAFAQMGAVFAELELNTTKVRMAYGKATLRKKIAAGEVNAKTGRPYREGREPYGVLPGESWEVVVAAFDETGSFLAAARKLNTDGVPTRLGRPWEVGTVSRIIRAHNLSVPTVGRRGVRARSRRIFSGLLRCVCGETLTSSPSSWRSADGVTHSGSVRYLCRSGIKDARHGKYQVAEPIICAWAEGQIAVALESLPVRAAPFDLGADGEKAAAIEAKRARIIDLYADGLIDKAKRDARLATLKLTEAQMQTANEWAGLVDTWSWDRDPGLVNADLRRLWQYVQLGTDLRPVRASWVPAANLWDELGPVPY
jgi:DNA invertase Pin-like site-specific DNA recombinase